MADIAAGKGKAASPFMTAKGARAGAVWQSQGKPAKAAEAKAKAKTVARLPAFIAPQLARSLEKPPAGAGWVHEIKFDGYRMQLRTVGNKAKLLTRKGLDWSGKFPEIVAAGAKLPDGIVDGEVVALDHTGAPDFAALQAAISDGKTKDLVYFAFDQMFAGAQDLRPLPLTERKARLQAELHQRRVGVLQQDHFLVRRRGPAVEPAILGPGKGIANSMLLVVVAL